LFTAVPVFSADVINVTSDTRVHIRSKDVFTRLVLHISLPAYRLCHYFCFMSPWTSTSLSDTFIGT